MAVGMEPLLITRISGMSPFHDQEPSNTASKTVTETTCSTNTHSSMNFKLLDTVCKQFNVDLDTLYAQVAQQHTEANREKHNHWQPPKPSTLPPGNVQCMMADKKELNINVAHYSAKKADTAPHPSDVIIEGITYTINMMKSSPVTGMANDTMTTT